MFKRKKSRSLIGFYLLLSYVLLQFIWWGYLMLMLNKKWFMVTGEGIVFLALLLIGAIRIRRTFKKETQLAQLQSNFMLSVTHELKSPIASARLQLETLLLRDIDKGKQREILTNAISDTDRLNALVENILLAARIDKSNFVFHKQEENISAHLLAFLSKPEIVPGHQLISRLEPGLHLRIDKIHFDSILLNLLDNACKYSAKGSPVTLELKKENNVILLTVADQGHGIRDAEKKKVFEKFYRVGSEETRTTKGTGLGLYIVRFLVEGHGGSIKILDNKPKGAIFRMEFRLS
jgi:two-component system phosphate regulon sensor histidine kinase PhoR